MAWGQNNGCASVGGLLLGPLMIIGSIWLLSWNEGRAVQAIEGVGSAAKAVVEAPLDSVDPAKDGKLIHLTGPAKAAGPIKDEDLKLSFDNQVAVVRSAEIYEWKEVKTSTSRTQAGGASATETTYEYQKVWTSTPIDSKPFVHPEGHENPDMKVGDKSFVADDAKLGAYTIDATTAGMLSPTQALTPAAPEGWTLDGGKYLSGDKDTPKIGDERVSYKGLPSDTVISVMAAQNKGGFSEYVAPNGYHMQMAVAGAQPASLMIVNKRTAEANMTWGLRIGGFILMFVGFAVFLGPLAAVASFIPFLGGLVRGAAFLASIVVSIPITLVVIGLSWVVFRPVTGILLLVAAAVAGAGLWFWHKRRPNPAAVAAPAATTPPAA